DLEAVDSLLRASLDHIQQPAGVVVDHDGHFWPLANDTSSMPIRLTPASRSPSCPSRSAITRARIEPTVCQLIRNSTAMSFLDAPAAPVPPSCQYSSRTS